MKRNDREALTRIHVLLQDAMKKLQSVDPQIIGTHSIDVGILQAMHAVEDVLEAPIPWPKKDEILPGRAKNTTHPR